MLEDKKAALRREIAAREKELAKIEALPDLSQLVDGCVLVLFVTHGASKPYTYIAYLTGGRFYLTGRTSPNGIDVDQLATWLSTGGRRLVSADIMGAVATVQTGIGVVFDLGSAAEALLGEIREGVPRMSGNSWNPFDGPGWGELG